MSTPGARYSWGDERTLQDWAKWNGNPRVMAWILKPDTPEDVLRDVIDFTNTMLPVLPAEDVLPMLPAAAPADLADEEGIINV